jgi:hypothetical protein
MGNVQSIRANPLRTVIVCNVFDQAITRYFADIVCDGRRV